MNTRPLVISYVIFRKAGSDPTKVNKYILSLIANIEAIARLCPKAQVWIYHDDSIGDEWLSLLKLAMRQSGINILLKQFNFPEFQQSKAVGHIELFGTLIRYLSLADFTDDLSQQNSLLLIRDADMILNKKDLEYIEKFDQKKDKFLHRYEDNKHYPWPLIGGSFAIKPCFLKEAGYTPKTWRQRILQFAKQQMQLKKPFRYYVDQEFLKEIYQELEKRNCLKWIDTTEIHITTTNEEKIKKNDTHYKLLWVDIADVLNSSLPTQGKSLQTWLCKHSDLVNEWVIADKNIVDLPKIKSTPTLYKPKPSKHARDDSEQEEKHEHGYDLRKRQRMH